MQVCITDSPFATPHNLASLRQNLSIPSSILLWKRGHAHTINVAMFVLGTHFNAHSKINTGALSVMVHFVMVTLVQLQVRLCEEFYLFHNLVAVCTATH